MNLLLDTHLVLWSTYESHRLSVRAKAMMQHPDSRLFFSTVNLWEITIKRSLGRPDFQVDPQEVRDTLLANGYGELVITSEHAIAVGGLPAMHGDPFDRLLIAQAAIEGHLLLTADRKVAKYPGRIQRV
jgi:PIN domain nuclease of toxin-antitoxin system